MKRSVYLTIIVLIAQAASIQAQGKRPVIPANAIEVVKVLPPRLEDWRVLRSTGETYLMQTLQTTAVRSFQEIPKQRSERPGAGASIKKADKVQGKMEISITDTGGFPGAMAQFVDFKEGKEERVEKKFIKSHPSISVSFGEEQHLTMLINRRFIVEFLYSGLEDRDLKDWMDAVNFRAISALPNGGPYVDETRDIEVMHITQGKGKPVIRKMKMHVVSAADMDKELARTARMDRIIESNGGLDEPAPPVPGEPKKKGPPRS